MMARTSATRALAVDLRHAGTHALLGVALLVPSARRAAMLVDGADAPVEPALAPPVWHDIDGWAAAGDARLPARPAPLSDGVVAALLGVERATVVGQRFASIPLSGQSDAAGATLQGLLAGLLETRRSATA